MATTIIHAPDDFPLSLLWLPIGKSVKEYRENHLPTHVDKGAHGEATRREYRIGHGRGLLVWREQDDSVCASVIPGEARPDPTATTSDLKALARWEAGR